MAEIKIDKLIRSRRRTIGLQITADAKLIVRAPIFTSEGHIRKLLDQKASWINSKLEYFRELRQKTVEKKFFPGEEFLYLGQHYPLIAVEDLPKAVIFDGSLKMSSVVLNNARDHLECWYKAQALDHITQRVKDLAALTDLQYRWIKVNDADTRWGSCGYKDTLNFTWRLIMAPPRVIDYVIVHELMHIKEKNHSRRFWAEVARIMPDYRQEERWLKKNGHLLKW